MKPWLPPPLFAAPVLAFVVLAAWTGPASPDPGSTGQSTHSVPVAPDGRALYQAHCSPCHGANGRGDGSAARFLDPAPRNFHDERIRYSSSASGGPSDHDLFEIVSAGLPGTAMPPFAGVLEDAERSAVIDVVRGFMRDGMRASLAEAGLPDSDLSAYVESEVRPGPTLRAPPQPPSTVESLARGRLHFIRLCASCHGQDGSGGIVPSTVGSARPVFARDLRRGVLKGGIEPGRLFVRIRAGVPGTPMPSLPPSSLDDHGVWDLVHFLETMIPPSAQRLHDPVGLRIVAPRSKSPLVSGPVPEGLVLAPEAALALLPFRERECAVRGALVQAVHDGTSIAFRVRYADPTWNRPGTDPATAPDGVAIRTTNVEKPPVLPLPGQPLPLDRALFLTGQKPDEKDPWFRSHGSVFENPDNVCRAPVGPELVGSGTWRDGTWTVTMIVRPERGGGIEAGSTLRVSLAVFDGASHAGPLPVAFSSWCDLLLLP